VFIMVSTQATISHCDMTMLCLFRIARAFQQ
jgi:hypothetical protein